MKIDPTIVSKLLALRNLAEHAPVADGYDEQYLKSLVAVALYYKRYEALEIVFDRLKFPSDLDLKQKITLWQLLESDNKK